MKLWRKCGWITIFFEKEKEKREDERNYERERPQYEKKEKIARKKWESIPFAWNFYSEHCNMVHCPWNHNNNESLLCIKRLMMIFIMKKHFRMGMSMWVWYTRNFWYLLNGKRCGVIDSLKIDGMRFLDLQRKKLDLEIYV